MVGAWLAVWVSSGWAFAPTEEAGAAPHRILPFRVSEQRELRDGPAWSRFISGDGSDWTARFDTATGLPRRASGPPILLDDVSDAKAVVHSLRTFLQQNPEILGVPLAALALEHAELHAPTDTWYVTWSQEVAGVPVWNARFVARIRGGRLVMIGNELIPDAPRWSGPVTRIEAIQAAQLDGPAPLAEHRNSAAIKTILPVPRGAHYVSRPAWRVTSSTLTPLGHWVSFVDAETGEILAWYNELSFLQGQVSAQHQARTVGDPMVDSPLSFAGLGSGLTTGSDGSFNVLSDALSVGLSGTYASVRNGAGAEGAMTVAEGDNLLTDEHATQAEINSYIFVNEVHAWALGYAPEVSWVTGRTTVNVNLDGACNAYFDGRSLNFYVEGSGCNNTGLIADVSYHEWGHGLHYYSLLSGYFDSAYSEGYSDTIAFLMTLDNIVAPGFVASNGAGIRDVAPDRVYPDDIDEDTHQTGLIYGGAAWDLLGLLQERYGDTGTKGEGWETMVRLTFSSVKAGPGIADTYDEMLFADDDNGDLSDGTPHDCEIIEAFGRHGLGPTATGGLVVLEHQGLGNQAPDTPARLGVGLTSLYPRCAAAEAESVTLYWSTDEGETWEEALVEDGETAELPGMPAGTLVWYYLRADTAVDTVYSPASGPYAPHTYYVGELTQLWCATFDDGDDGGFTHALLDGNDQEGADDWQFDRPAGRSGDPTRAYSGDMAWGNDLGYDNYNGAYQPDVVNRLQAPPLTLDASGPLIIQFRRWLNIEDGHYDTASVYGNDEVLWTNHGTSQNRGDEHTEDATWVLHTLRAAPAGDTLTLAWELDSDGGLEFGGWNLDDVCVYTVATTEDGNVGSSDEEDPMGTFDDGEILKIGQAGCGCASSGVDGGFAAAAVSLLALLRRRKASGAS